MNGSIRFAAVLLLVIGVLLGLTLNLAKLAAAVGWPPLAFLFWSLLGGGVLLAILAVARGERPRLGSRHLRYYLASGLISISLPNALMFSAIPHVGASYASMCLAFPPLLTYLLALALRMERLQGIRLVGIVLGLGGTLLLAIGKVSDGDSPLGWVLAVLAVPVFLALGNIYRTRYWPEGASPLALAPGMLLGGAVLLLPAMWFGVDFSIRQPEAHAWLLPVQVLLFAAVYALYFVLQKVAGPVFLSQIGSVAAIAGAAIAIFALNERGSLSLLVAALAILVGVLLVALPQRQAVAPAETKTPRDEGGA